MFSARLLSGIAFTLGSESFKFAQGETFDLGVSYKYPHEKFRQIAETAGLKPLELMLGPKSRLALHVFGL